MKFFINQFTYNKLCQTVYLIFVFGKCDKLFAKNFNGNIGNRLKLLKTNCISYYQT